MMMAKFIGCLLSKTNWCYHQLYMWECYVSIWTNHCFPINKVLKSNYDWKSHQQGMHVKRCIKSFNKLWQNIEETVGWGIPTKGHFTHETDSTWPFHFKHSQWWKRQSRSKFTSHYAWGTNGVCECKMDIKWTLVPMWYQMYHVSWSLGFFSKPTSWR